MANNKIKGLTVEIGGDTTGLGKALESVNKKSSDLSAELGQINKLLKLDPKNTELLGQKQKVLADAVANTAKKLDKLKEAEKQVQKQFERGEVTEEQVRALQREIIATEKKMAGYEKAAKETAEQVENLGKKTEDTAEKTSKFGETAKAVGAGVGKAFAAVGAAVAAAGAALVASAEATREYRTEMGKLDTAFTSAGHSSEAATATYKALQGVLGETDQAVEAANHLAQLTDSEQDLQKWTDICTGVYATFGASLPIEGLTEAANETAKVGQVTGPLADALNWAGVSEDAFNESLAACSNEQERQTLIMETLSGLYEGAAGTYKETNAEIIRANEANEAWTASLAEVGGSIEPILTDVKMLGASLLSDLVPGVKEVAGALRNMLNGEDGAAADVGVKVGNLLGEIINKATELVPAVVEVGISLVTSLGTAVIEKIPALVQTIVDVLISGIPQLIDGATQFLLAILDALPAVVIALVAAAPDIVMAVVDGLLASIPQLIDGALKCLLAIVDAIPLLIEKLVPRIPEIVTTIILGLLDAIPQLIDAAFQLLMAIPKAIPSALKALIKALPQIGSTIINYLKQLPGKILEIGKSLVEGLWKGIKDRVKWLKDKITGWVGDVTGFLKKLFGINSPSKVTAWMGEMLDEGLAKGIDDGAKAPLNAMSDLSSDLIHEAGHVDGMAIERKINHSYSINAAAATQQSAATVSKLDQILQAIERGQVLTIDGKVFIGSTVDKYDAAMGQRRVLAARGAI